MSAALLDDKITLPTLLLDKLLADGNALILLLLNHAKLEELLLSDGAETLLDTLDELDADVSAACDVNCQNLKIM